MHHFTEERIHFDKEIVCGDIIEIENRQSLE